MGSIASRGVPAHDDALAVVWLDGEEDIATVALLADRLARAVATVDGDLIVDLSGLTFLSTATIDELTRVGDNLLHENRNLSLRSPSPFADRLLNLWRLIASAA